jgi:hypothetical protein
MRLHSVRWLLIPTASKLNAGFLSLHQVVHEKSVEHFSQQASFRQLGRVLGGPGFFLRDST